MVIAHEDITQRRHAERVVTQQADLLDEVDVSVIATNEAGQITHWNRGAERLFGWTRVEAIGARARALAAAVDAEHELEIVGGLRQHGHWEGETVMSRRDGSTFPAYVRDRAMLDADGRPTGMIGIAVDITDRVAAERRLVRTRNHLRAVADSMGEGLFTLDPDGCVTFMNPAAEELLGWTGIELAGRVMHDLTHAHRPDGSGFPIEECPILRVRRDGVTVRVEDDVFTRRDGRLLPVSYTASPFQTNDGVEGCVVVFEDITERKARQDSLEQEVERLSWIARVQDALAEDRLLLYAQPIIDLRTREVVQRELLLRLREPDGEIIGPAAFLQIAEEFNLIGEIDRWVIERGIEIASTGHAVEINLSARSVGDQGILEHIERTIARTGADPTRVVFEITETAMVEDNAAAFAFAERLHALGCKLALDDFGTGYGGLIYLKTLPVDFMKIDIEFVRDLIDNPGSRQVVQAVVALARGFGLKTVAEGVEDAETFELLIELGVDYGQGFHIACPRPLDSTVAGLFQDRQPRGLPTSEAVVIRR